MLNVLIVFAALCSGETSAGAWTQDVAQSVTAAAAQHLGVAVSQVQVNLQGTLTAALELPGGPAGSQQHTAAAQAVAQFLEVLGTAAGPSVLVGVDLVRPTALLQQQNSSEVVIAVGSISALGDMSQTLAIAAAMQQQCPELSVKGLTFSAEGSECAELLMQYYLSALDSSAVAVNSSSTHSAAVRNSSSNNATPAGSTTTAVDPSGYWEGNATVTAADFTASVVVPLVVKTTITITVNAATGQDTAAMDAAAHTWLASDEFEQLLQQQGLRSGKGSPSRLVAIMPPSMAAVSGSTAAAPFAAAPGGDHDGDKGKSSNGTSSRQDSPWQKSNHSVQGKHNSQERAAVTAAAGQPETAETALPGTTAAQLALQPGREDLAQQLQQDIQGQQSRGQSIALIVGTLAGTAVLGAGAAVGFVVVIRKRRQRKGKGKGDAAEPAKRRRVSCSSMWSVGLPLAWHCQQRLHLPCCQHKQ